MKRIVDGVTYNTATSTVLAKAEIDNDDGEGTETLYQTRGGAFYTVLETEKAVWNEREREHQTKEIVRVSPMSPEEANEWMMTGDVEIFENPFEDPPEATAEAEPGATIYVRVPAVLKRSVDEAARKAGVSGNVWVMRCIEGCLKAA